MGGRPLFLQERASSKRDISEDHNAPKNIIPFAKKLYDFLISASVRGEDGVISGRDLSEVGVGVQ